MNTIKINSKKVKLVAHRGVCGLEKENTCASFVAAGNRSYYGIETDIHLNKDKQFVIMHDDNTQRASNGSFDINIEENSFSEVENIILPDVDGSFDRRDLRVPLLKEYIKICKKYEKTCILEIKSQLTEDETKMLIDEITALGYIEKITFITWYIDVCKFVRKYLPDNEIQVLASVSDISDEFIQTLAENKFDIDINYTGLEKKHVKLFHSKGIKVNCWTCNSPDEAKALIKMGVDFITTNILE